MKSLFLAAALVGAAVLPATAGAVPLGGNACFIVSTPATPASCNFTGASGGIGYGGGTDGSYKLTHIRKANVCTNGVVTSYVAQVVTDASGEGGESGYSPFDFEDGPSYSFTTGRVYTFALSGNGFAAVGGQSGPAAAEPATPSEANNWAGADTSTASPLGSLC